MALVALAEIRTPLEVEELPHVVATQALRSRNCRHRLPVHWVLIRYPVLRPTSCRSIVLLAATVYANCTAPLSVSLLCPFLSFLMRCRCSADMSLFYLPGHSHCMTRTSLATFSVRQEQLTVLQRSLRNGTIIDPPHPVVPSLAVIFAVA